MRAGPVLAACALALAMACTVDELVGSNVLSDGGNSADGGNPVDAGTPICPGTGPDCSPVCGDQVCNSGCTDLRDCVISCSGTSCSFRCEHSGSDLHARAASPGRARCTAPRAAKGPSTAR